MTLNEVTGGIPKSVPYYEVHGLYFSSDIAGRAGKDSSCPNYAHMWHAQEIRKLKNISSAKWNPRHNEIDQC
jgi:hypothetical protein